MKPTTVQRLLGFTIGVGTAGFVYFSDYRLVWRQAAEVAQTYGTLPAPSAEAPTSPEKDQPLLGPKFWGTLARRWNQGVDATFGALATELAKRGY